MNTKLSKFFDIDFIDTSIRQYRTDFDIEVRLASGEHIRFFIYTNTADFSISWYGTSAGYADTVKIDYITSVAKIANKLNNKENLLSFIDILRSVK